MSYWVTLHAKNGHPLELNAPHGINGGTYALNTSECELNITYNYADILRRVIPGGLSSIDGQTAEATKPIIENAVAQLGDDTHHDYWRATEGNVKTALLGLLVFAGAHPGGVWRVE